MLASKINRNAVTSTVAAIQCNPVQCDADAEQSDLIQLI